MTRSRWERSLLVIVGAGGFAYFGGLKWADEGESWTDHAFEALIVGVVVFGGIALWAIKTPTKSND